LGFLIIVRGMGVFRDHFRCDIRWEEKGFDIIMPSWEFFFISFGKEV